MQNLCEVKAYLGEEVRVGRARQMTWIAGRTWVGLIGGGAWLDTITMPKLGLVVGHGQ